MKIYQFSRTQKLKIGIKEAWDFFSNPKNLSEITPNYMGFNITIPIEDKMFEGQIIAYTVRPVLGISVRWITEIKHVDKPYSFVDEQRFGPYKFWHHRHTFREVEGGIEMTDLVHYSIPFVFFESMVNTFVVRKKLEEIFDFRYKVLDNKFNNFIS